MTKRYTEKRAKHDDLLEHGSKTGEGPNAKDDAKPVGRPRRRRVWLWSLALTVAALGAGGIAWLGVGEGDTAPKAQAPRAPIVRVAAVAQRDMVVQHHYRGELVADVAELSAQTVGELREVRVQLGDTVRKNQVLALVDASLARRQLTEARAQVQVAQAEQARAQAELATARVERDRANALLREQIITEQEAVAARSRIEVLQAQVDSAKARAAQAQAHVSLLAQGLAQTQVLAPFDGAIAQRYLDPGAIVQPGTPILRMVADGNLRVRFRAPESALPLVDVGQRLTLRTQSTQGETFAGLVTRRSAEVSPVDRSVAVEGELEQKTSRLLPGMYANVTVSAETLKNALVVPNAALVERYRAGQPQTGVYVVDDQELLAASAQPEGAGPVEGEQSQLARQSNQANVQFIPVSVRGQDAQAAAVEPLAEPGQAVAETGLSIGALVVTFGADALSDGAVVRVLTQEQAATAAPPSTEPVVR